MGTELNAKNFKARPDFGAARQKELSNGNQNRANIYSRSMNYIWDGFQAVNDTSARRNDRTNPKNIRQQEEVPKLSLNSSDRDIAKETTTQPHLREAAQQLRMIEMLCTQIGLKYVDIPPQTFGLGIGIAFGESDYVVLTIMGGGAEGQVMITSGKLNEVRQDRLAALNAANYLALLLDPWVDSSNMLLIRRGRSVSGR